MLFRRLPQHSWYFQARHGENPFVGVADAVSKLLGILELPYLVVDVETSLVVVTVINSALRYFILVDSC